MGSGRTIRGDAEQRHIAGHRHKAISRRFHRGMDRVLTEVKHFYEDELIFELVKTWELSLHLTISISNQY